MSEREVRGQRLDIRGKRQSSLFQLLTSNILLLLFFALSLSQLTSTSPTFDEGFYILRGYAFLRTGHLIPLGHPPFAQTLSALGVILEPNLPDPRTLEGWATDKYDTASHNLLWQRGLNTTRIVFLARFPILLLGLIVGAITFKWAKELFGWGSGIAALALHALSPNLLAHAALATTDLPVAAFYFFTLYFFYHFSRKQNLVNTALTGLSLGLALASKFSALLLLPTLILIQFIRPLALMSRPDMSFRGAFSTTRNLFALPQRFLAALGMTSLSFGFWILAFGFFTLWSTYFFSTAFTQYFSEFTHLNQLASEGHNAYLLGEISTKGWGYYHLFVFLVKTPIPVLILFAVGIWQMADSRWPLRVAASRNNIAVYVLLPTLIYFLAASLTSLNVGYRYLLPIIPLIHIIASSMVRSWNLRFEIFPLFIVSLFIVHSFSTFFSVPNFISYFNEFVGVNGYKVLSDSNVDWGQDLPALAKRIGGHSIYFSYFGQADPAYYGIDAAMLPGWPPPRMEPTFYSPADPAPGLYAISASNLVGVQLYDANAFAYFRELKPALIVNHSILLFEIPERKPVTTIAQCTPALLPKTDSLINKPVRQITFDCDQSLIIPAQPTLLLYPLEKNPVSSVGNPVYQWRWNSGIVRYRLYRVTASAPTNVIASSKYLTLESYELTNQSITLHWRVNEPAPPPVSIFVHFNYPDGALADSADGLGVSAEQWQRGDVLITKHLIPKDLPQGTYEIKVGLYSLANGERYSEINLMQFKK